MRSAITASYLLRQMAKRESVEPAVQQTMRENADLFEDHAIGVMLTAARTNRQESARALDCQLRLWTGMTLLDLAVKGDCGRFVERCCDAALRARLFGDIDPYANPTAKIVFNMMCLGLPCAISESFLQYQAPPIAEVTRGATQRRIRPKGYPYKLHSQGKSAVARKMSTAQAKAQDMNLQQLNNAWRHTFSATERWQLFWKSPVVLYIVNTFFSVAVTIFFTEYFVRRLQLFFPKNTARACVVCRVWVADALPNGL